MYPYKKLCYLILATFFLVLFLPRFDTNIPKNYKIISVNEPLIADFRNLDTNTLEKKYTTRHTQRNIPEAVRIYKMTATAYAPHDPGAIKGVCHDGNPNSTATGTYPTPGRTIAVDPNIIPLGSTVEIDGMGTYIAEDIGGLIKGYKIDICMASKEEALAWGVKEVTVFVR